MRVLIDTNILISAILGHGTPFLAYQKAVSFPHTALICEQNIHELRRIFQRKFPHKTAVMENFLSIALLSLECVPIPDTLIPEEEKIRDVADRPILRAAIAAKADILLTGDKDFLEAEVTMPRILSAAEFLRL